MKTRQLARTPVRSIAAALTLCALSFPAQATYWSLFNIEGESGRSANYVTYASRDDMLTDSNRVGVFVPGTTFADNVVGSGSDGSLYWSLFNIEGESTSNASYVTYASLEDMLLDTNRLSVSVPGSTFAGNVVGSGSDGSVYWSLFNIEGESVQNANYVTYANLGDMLLDTNRLSVSIPGSTFAGNVVGSGSDGSVYWSLFNIEGESTANANYVTYASLEDMLLDTNRLSVSIPGSTFAGNVVGSGSDVVGPVSQVPEPSTWMMTGLGLAALLLRVSRGRSAVLRR